VSASDRGLVFNLQKYSIQDGPGIRTTVFLKGCPLHCAWCHNPESISAGKEVLLLENRCMGCAQCRAACRYGVAFDAAAPLPARNVRCDTCGQCVDACPTGARQMVGCEMTVDQVLAEIRRDLTFYEDSGGGVTFSGGEPLLQARFLKRVLQACRQEGISTAIDTCGYAPRETLVELAPLTDLFLYDIKLMDDGLHRQYTGVSNRRILENLQALAGVHDRIWVRVPVIPDVNDGVEALGAIAAFVRPLRSVRQVNLLPYHRAAQHKQHALGGDPAFYRLEPPSPEVIENAMAVFRTAGLSVVAGG
jgi:pyruvate formate lyase activating enzyme